MSIFGFVVDLFWLAFAGLILVGFVYLAYAQGWFGVATRARGLLIIDGLQKRSVKINEQIDKWQAKVSAQADPIAAPVAPVRDKAARLAENAALLASGTITQAQADAAAVQILAGN